ncbi:hypothetical protein GCM10027341_55260 [Spirosoma knui]
MKASIGLMLIGWISWNCAGNPRSLEKETKLSPPPAKATQAFTGLADFPTIRDTAAFIRQLRQTFQLSVHGVESPAQAGKQRITRFQKLKLFGSPEDFYLIEYDWVAGSMGRSRIYKRS